MNTMKQLPLTFLNVQLPLIPIAKLDSHLSILFGKLSILYDQDLINMVIALLLNKPTMHPGCDDEGTEALFGIANTSSSFCVGAS